MLTLKWSGKLQGASGMMTGTKVTKIKNNSKYKRQRANINTKGDIVKMKYYSEITNKIYETREELEAAEQNHKEKLVAKAKEEELRKAELEKAVTARDNAKAEYETALKVCREALTNWSKAESALNELQQKTGGTKDNNRSEDYSDVIDVVKHLAEQANKWFGLGY